MIAPTRSHKILSLMLGFAAMILSGLHWHWGIAAWLTPLFVLFFSRNTKKRFLWVVFATALIAGSISRACLAANDKTLSNLLSNGFLYAIPFILPYALDRLCYRKTGNALFTLIFPVTAGLVEFFVSSISGSWGCMAHTLRPDSLLAQSVSLTGIFGPGFLMAWFGSLANRVIEKGFRHPESRRWTTGYVSLLLVLYAFGLIQVMKKEEGKSFRVAAIQGKTDIIEVFTAYDSVFRALSLSPGDPVPQEIFSSPSDISGLLSDSEEALDQGARIVVWNEYALVLNRSQQEAMVEKMGVLCEKYKAYVLLSFLGQSSHPQPKAFNNTCLLLTPEGELAWKYLKSGLHPSAEKPFMNEGDKTMPYVDTEYGRLGGLICYDLDLFPLSKQTREKNIDILLVPAFDWDEITPLHANMAAFEAIRHKVHLIRPDGNGYTRIFNPGGRNIGRPVEKTENPAIVFANIPWNN